LATEECWEALSTNQPEEEGDDLFSTFSHAQSPEIAVLRDRLASRLSQFRQTRPNR
jgi:hypothetical protein